MLKKIDKFIDKYLNWNVLKNVLLAELALIPHLLIVKAYSVSVMPLLIMNLSFGLSVSLFGKAFSSIVKKEESL